MRNSISPKARLVLALTALMATSVASSFVPITGLVNVAQRKITYLENTLRVSGGSDAVNQNLPPSDDANQVTPLPPPVDSEVAPTETSPDNFAKSMLGPNAPPPGLLRRTFPNFPWHRLPNMLTYMRCLAIPALIGVFYSEDRHVATGTLFALASFTDWLDGYLARKWDITSAFGAFLDPVTDKLMVSTALILLAGRYGARVAVPACIILAREIAVSALREWMAQRGQRDVVQVGMQGKIKTALTMVAATTLLFVPQSGNGPLSKLYTPGLVLLYLCTLVTVTSGSIYFIAAAPLLLERK